ncbi:MAG: hypothetical protein JST93_14980 [Acidobacteria bacterium]|nr:hypothetical protein [Acidobacteriota bacterium]
MMPIPLPPMLTEVFCAIQGEGSLNGVPAVFLVTRDGPPLHVWSTKERAQWTPDFNIAISALLAGVRRSWYDFAVFTGGEPLRVSGLEMLAQKLRLFDHHVTVETSGSFFAEDFPCDLMSVNITLSSAPAGKKTKKPPQPGFDMDVLRKIVAHYPHQLKFHCTDASEWEEIRRIAGECDVKRSNVYLIPTAAKGKELASQMEWLEELSRVQGYRFAPRPCP